jgi:NitT/TauT family transport system substrate-binding protein
MESKRKTLLACLGGFALLMPVLVAPVAGQTLEKVKVVIPQNSVFILNWMGAKDAGVFQKHGIDLDVDPRPFAGYLAALPAKQCEAATYSGLEGIEKINQGLDWAVIGGGLTVLQDIYVLKNSPLQSVKDLRGKKVGVWSTGAGAYKAARAAILESSGLDLAKDTQLVQLEAPALFKLLEKGSIDAMLNISTFTIKAESEPDKFRSLFSPNEYWKKKTGYPIVWSAPLIAWRGWVSDNPTRAKNFAEATEESYRWLRKPENLDAAVKKYGELAGVSDPATVATYKRLLGEKRIFLAHWDQKVVDAEWQFLELSKKYGILDKVPDKSKHAMVLEQ